jgi:hypothetical protein
MNNIAGNDQADLVFLADYQHTSKFFDAFSTDWKVKQISENDS